MAQTSIPVGSPLAAKVFGAALFASQLRAANMLNNITGPAPKQADAERKMKGQTSPDMPVVRVTDLAKTQGDTVSVDMFNMFSGKPLVGDVNAEGKGEKLTFSSMDIKIDLMTKVGDGGGKMTQQRTKWQLRSLVLANLAGYMPRLESQQCLVHLAGERGSQTGNDWVVPLSSDADYDSIMVNTVKAPTYNRHYVVNSTDLTQGGQQLGSIATTDTFKLAHIDAIREILDDLDMPLQPVKIADDPAANDDPMYLLLVSPRVYSQLLTDTTSNGNIRAFQQNAWNRASYGSKSPLFRGEVGMWNGILVKKMPRSIRLAGSASTKIITSANRYTATESSQSVAALDATHAVDRSLLLGAQALGNCYGRNQGSDYYYSFLEHLYNFERNYEGAAEAMNGKAKIRFSIPDGAGNVEPTDTGVFVIDSVVKI